MNDFDVVTGPAPGGSAARLKPSSAPGGAEKKLGEHGAAERPSLPSPARREGEKE